MQVIKPITFESAQLLTTTAVDSNAAYSAATTYALGAKVTYGMFTYESLQAANTGHTPDSSPTWWINIGASNKYAMFDRQVSSSTTKTSSLIVTLKPGVGFNSLALINVVTDLVKITVRENNSSGAIVYENTSGVSSGAILSWYDYFFNNPLIKRSQVIFELIPGDSNSHITLEFTSTTTISVGACLYGTMYQLGATQYGARASIVDYSKKDTDEFGNTTFVKREFSKRLECNFTVNNVDLNVSQSIIYGMRAEPSVWIASSDPTYEESLIVYGFYKDISTEISYPTHALMSITLEGLT